MKGRALAAGICLLICTPALAQDPWWPEDRSIRPRPFNPEPRDIHTMAVGGKLLRLVHTRQLTTDRDIAWFELSPDGEFAAYLTITPDVARLSIAPAAGGASRQLLSGRRQQRLRPGEWVMGPLASADQMGWSPVGGLLVYPARRISESGAAEDWMVAVTAGGERKWSCRVPEARSGGNVLLPGTGLHGPMVWSPDGRKFALTRDEPNPDPQGEMLTHSIYIFDLKKEKPEVVRPSIKGDYWPMKWGADGHSLVFKLVTHVLQPPSMRPLSEETWSVDLHNLATTRLPDWADPFFVSPDGTHLVTLQPKGKPGMPLEGLTMMNLESHRLDWLGLSQQDKFLGWAPNSRLIVVHRCDEVRVEDGWPDYRLGSLWLSGTERNELGTMCVAFDADTSNPSWSTDCTRMAYTSSSGLNVAEFEWSDAAPSNPQVETAD